MGGMAGAWPGHGWLVPSPRRSCGRPGNGRMDRLDVFTGELHQVVAGGEKRGGPAGKDYLGLIDREDATVHQLDHEGLEGLAAEVLTQRLLKLVRFHAAHGI